MPVAHPEFSPDGKFIAFQDGKGIAVVAAAGGQPKLVIPNATRTRVEPLHSARSTSGPVTVVAFVLLP